MNISNTDFLLFIVLLFMFLLLTLLIIGLLLFLSLDLLRECNAKTEFYIKNIH